MSDKFISDLDRVKTLKSNDLIPISQGVDNKEFYATSSQLIGDDTKWQKFDFSSNYIHPEPTDFPKYRKVGKVTHLSGSLFIPQLTKNKTQNFQSVKVNTNSTFLSDNESVLFYNKNNAFTSIRLDAAPEKSVFFRNIVLSRRYVVEIPNTNPLQFYGFLLSTVVTLEIGQLGWVAVHSISAKYKDYIYNGNSNNLGHIKFESNPLNLLATVLRKNEEFPSFNQVNVGFIAENNAITIPPFSNTVLVPEDIDTTKVTDLGGFRINLSGMQFVNSIRKEWDYAYNRS